MKIIIATDFFHRVASCLRKSVRVCVCVCVCIGSCSRNSRLRVYMYKQTNNRKKEETTLHTLCIQKPKVRLSMDVGVKEYRQGFCVHRNLVAVVELDCCNITKSWLDIIKDAIGHMLEVDPQLWVLFRAIGVCRSAQVFALLLEALPLNHHHSQELDGVLGRVLVIPQCVQNELTARPVLGRKCGRYLVAKNLQHTVGLGDLQTLGLLDGHHRKDGGGDNDSKCHGHKRRSSGSGSSRENSSRKNSHSSTYEEEKRNLPVQCILVKKHCSRQQLYELLTEDRGQQNNFNAGLMVSDLLEREYVHTDTDTVRLIARKMTGRQWLFRLSSRSTIDDPLLVINKLNDAGQLRSYRLGRLGHSSHSDLQSKIVEVVKE
jgi:hypothetical protein